jgi:hypothetical protein
LTLKLCRGEILLPQVPFWNSKKKKKILPSWKLGYLSRLETLDLGFNVDVHFDRRCVLQNELFEWG